MIEDPMAPRWRGEPGVFEIWFLVAFERTAPRAWWLRWTTFAAAAGAPRGTIWAAAFEAGRPARWGKRFVPIDAIRTAVHDLARGVCAGSVEANGGTLAWDLALRGGDGRARGPGWLHRVPTPTRVEHVRSEAGIVGTVRLGDEPERRIDGVGTLKHIWGTRRVEELYWLYCPLLDDGGAIEATGVRVQRDRGPAISPIWLRTGEEETRWWSVPGLFRRRVTPESPGRLRVRATSTTRRLDAVATYDPATLAGYVYRDPSGFDVHVAQSDVATCEVVVWTRPHPLARWGAPRRLAGSRAAVELHELAPLPGVRYVAWDDTMAREVSA
jgi:hypothetical protein